jgi:hypothetical protein
MDIYVKKAIENLQAEQAQANAAMLKEMQAQTAWLAHIATLLDPARLQGAVR